LFLDVARAIERHARDFFAGPRAGSNSGEKQQIAYTLGVRERAHRLRRAVAFENLAHSNWSLASEKLRGSKRILLIQKF